MESRNTHLAALAILLFLATFVFIGHRSLERFRAEERDSPYSSLANKLNQHRGRETCDVDLAKHRLDASAVLDRFRTEIRALWKERTASHVPKFSLLDLGVLKLRINPRTTLSKGFDASSWSWSDAYGLIRKTQTELGNPDNTDRWRDIDAMVRFLLEKDYGRIVLGKKFLAPELTQHQFRPNPSVTRTGLRDFTVKLDPGDFRGREKPLQAILEGEWRGLGHKIKIIWVKSGAYRLLAHSNSARSFVNHKRRTMEIANLAWTRTVAHELGHVLGFDDHYYNVWNARNCYYSQESRLGDLMSNSEHGGITARHWEILGSAYPWKSEGPKEPFAYAYGK